MKMHEPKELLVEHKVLGVLFDIGGVLLDFDHMKSCTQLAAISGLTPDEVYRRLFKSGLETAFDLGMDSSLFYTEVLTKLNISQEKISIELFSRIWGAIFKERPEVTKIVEELQDSTQLFVLSNTNALHYSYIEEHYPFFSNFEKQFLSFRLKLRKPDPLIFSSVVDSTGLAPASILYFDDMREHVEAAKEAGINAKLFTSIDAMKTVLRSAGL